MRVLSRIALLVAAVAALVTIGLSGAGAGMPAGRQSANMGYDGACTDSMGYNCAGTDEMGYN